ncbi:MAG: cytochrome c [Deltaproteobacteria bacterium]|nr:cytochrome c [Deltaproteobacteria bacterium]
MRLFFTLLTLVAAQAATPEDAAYQQGELLYHAAGCVGCHSVPGLPHLGGGRDNPTVFGTFYAPNISPNVEQGIGSWTEGDFYTAMRDGRAPDGRLYWPTFPTMAYTKMSDADIHALWVYVSAQPAVVSEERAHEPRRIYSLPGMLNIWRLMEFRPGPMTTDPSQSAEWSRGEYLVQAVTYCDQCHTPRSKIGRMKRGRYMAGGANLGKLEIHPNLTPHPEAGIGAWSEDDMVRFLTTGEKPDGTRAREDWVMHEKVKDSYSRLSEDDKRAIYAYLRTLPADDFDPEARWGDEAAP